MDSLPIEVKYVIAGFDEEVWYKLYLYDAAFAKEAKTQYMINRYIELFAKITPNSTKLFGKLHSINDKPAVIHAVGTQYWYKNGKYHRDGDKPAVIYSKGARFWYKNGKFHRDGDQPSAIHTDGTLFWHREGRFHRDGDKPAIIYSDGRQEWWVNGSRVK